jgi:hypothetical protein
VQKTLIQKKEYTLLDFMKIERFRYSHINMKKKKICTLGLYEDLIIYIINSPYRIGIIYKIEISKHLN